VGIFSPELFHKNVNGPQLNYYAANQITFTVSSDSDCLNCAVGYYPPNLGGSFAVPNMLVTVVNTGGSGTYGPIQAQFSAPNYTTSADPVIVNFEGNNAGSGDWVTPQAGNDPPNPPCDCGTAISNLGSGSEIGAFAQTQVGLIQGYFNGNNQNNTFVDDNDQQFSVAFTLSQGTDAWDGVTVYPVPITLTMLDGIGKTYTSVFYIYLILQ